MSYLMGIDLGTSSVKTAVMDTEGNLKGLGQENYPVETPAAGYAEQDMELLWEATAKTIGRAIADSGVDPSDIRGIGFSGQMHGLVLVDRHIRPIRPAIIWVDQRSQKQIAEIYNIVGKDSLRGTTLNSLSPGFFICSLMWVRDNEPGNYDKIYRAMLPKDYIRYKLCGVLGTDVTDASASLAFDTSKRCWAFDIIEKIGIKTEFFPHAGETCEVAGKTTEDCREKTGLCPGTPVVYGGGDTLMHSVGNGIIKPGVISVNIGTAGQISSAVNTPVYDRKFRTNTFCHVGENLWIIFGGHLNGGIALNWLKNNFFPDLSYRDFDRIADEVPAGSEGLLFLPYLTGERTPYQDPNAKGIFFGLTLAHNYRHMIRAVMEGVTLPLRHSLEIFKELNIPIERVVASGGGAKSKVWLQMQADIFNTGIRTVSGREVGCIGAAIAAGVGVQIYDSVEQACEAVVRYNPEVIEPKPEHAGIYQEAFEKSRKLYYNNRNLFDENV